MYYMYMYVGERQKYIIMVWFFSEFYRHSTYNPAGTW